MKTCFVFDIDGTLIDSQEVDHTAMQLALREQGHEHEQSELQQYFGKPGRVALQELGVADIEGMMQRWEALAYANLDQIPVFEGIVSVLEALRARGAKLGVVTSRTRYQLDAGFTPLGLNKYFDTFVCADDVAHPKPAPDSMIECLRRLDKTSEQAVYIGDSKADMACAKAAGVESVLALWGAHEPDSIMSDRRFAAPAEILNL